MQYLLLICGEEASEGTREEQPGDIERWLAENETRRLLGSQLAPPSDATTVRMRYGKLMLTDGPYAETKEWIAGFDLIECENLDEAIEIASRHPVAGVGMIEIRPVHS